MDVFTALQVVAAVIDIGYVSVKIYRWYRSRRGKR
jgi:hypothetical protein